jgi:glycosyltransferase involved in cell wall biosynthesis
MTTDRMTASTRPRRAAMLTHSYYEEDARVRREAEALVARGWQVDIFGLRRHDEPEQEETDGVRLRRLPVSRHQGAGIGTYLREYLEFFALAGAAVTRAQPRRRYHVVQVHTLPDFLVFAGLPLRLAGVPLVLDLHEAMPEFFRMRFPRAANPVAYRGLRLQERLSIAASSAVITVNDALAARLHRLGVRPAKVTVVMNTPNLRLFDRDGHASRRFMEDGTLRLTYTGALTPVYELDVLIGAVAILGHQRPGLPVQLDIYGRGDQRELLRSLSHTVGVADRVTIHDRIPLEDVPAAVAAADIGVAPTRRDPMTDLSLSTKIFEYSAMGKAVVASRLSTVERYFAADTLAMYPPGDAAGLAATVLRLVDEPEKRAARIATTERQTDELSWERQAEGYATLLERLARRR